MKKEDEELLLKEGFNQIAVRDVPPGRILNRETEGQFELVLSGTWLDPDQNFMICSSFIEKDGFDLLPNNQKTDLKYANLYPIQRGSIEFLLTKMKEINQSK